MVLDATRASSYSVTCFVMSNLTMADHLTSSQSHMVTVDAGSRLLERSLAEARRDENIRRAYLHVQSNNEEAIRFYQLFNFEYYRKLMPPDAVVLRRELIHS